MAVVTEWLFTMTEILILVSKVSWFDILSKEHCDGVINSIIGLIELDGNQVPIILGNPIQALSIVSELVRALGQRETCNIAYVGELKDASANGFHIIVIQKWSREFAFFSYSHTNCNLMDVSLWFL